MVAQLNINQSNFFILSAVTETDSRAEHDPVWSDTPWVILNRLTRSAAI